MGVAALGTDGVVLLVVFAAAELVFVAEAAESFVGPGLPTET